MNNNFFNLNKKIVAGSILVVACLVAFSFLNDGFFQKDDGRIRLTEEEYADSKKAFEEIRDTVLADMNRRQEERATIHINGVPVVVGPVVESEVLSPFGNFKYARVCAPNSDACNGKLIEIKTGREISISTMESFAFFDEDYFFGMGTTFAGNSGFYLVVLSDFQKELARSEASRDAFKISEGPDNFYFSNINLLSDRVVFVKTYPGDVSSLEEVYLYEYFIDDSQDPRLVITPIDG